MHKPNILIVDDNTTLLSFLVRYVQEEITDWNIISKDNYNDAVNILDNCRIDILICDLFLFHDEEHIDLKNSIPSGIKIARKTRDKNNTCFIIVVSSSFDSFLLNYQLVNYIDIGVNAFLDRSAAPNINFKKVLQYQLKVINRSILQSKDALSKLWTVSSINITTSYLILICAFNDQSHHYLIKDFLFWKNTLIRYVPSTLLVDINDEKISYLIEHEIINDINDYPTLLIAKSSTMLPNIKISSSLLKIIHKNNNLTKFLNLVNIQLPNKTIMTMKQQMKSSKYWEKWLNIDENKDLPKENIINIINNGVILNDGDSYQVEQAGSVGKQAISDNNTFTDSRCNHKEDSNEVEE
ncbi:MAG: response regulator [Cyanobacteria bacterium J06621_12]